MANGVRTLEERVTAIEVGLLGVAGDVAEVKTNITAMMGNLARRPSWAIVAGITASLSLNVGLLVALVNQVGR